MISQSVLSKLKEFGLNSYEGKIWTALLMKGKASAGTLSEMAGVPRSRCYDVLESLEKKGFIIAKLGRPIQYLAVPPQEVVERVKEQIRNNTEEQIQVIDQMKNTSLMSELNELHTSGSQEIPPEELAGILKQNRNVKNHLLSIMKKADYIYLAMNESNMYEHYNLLKHSLQSRSKAPIVKALLPKKADKALLDEFARLGEIKTHDGLHPMCITNEHAALYLGSDEHALWVSSEPVVRSLNALFDAHWEAV